MATLYDKIKAAGIETDSHESDLYILASAEAFVILHQHPEVKYQRFLGADGRYWLDAPFMFSPWWDHKARAS